MRRLILFALLLLPLPAFAADPFAVDRSIINAGSIQGDGTGDTPFIFSRKSNTNSLTLFQRTELLKSWIQDNGLIGTNAMGNASTNSEAWRVALQLNLPLNVKWFGAKGDGVTDDTAAIQSAVNSATNLLGVARCAHLYFPRGSYKISAPISIEINTSFETSWTIEGDGPLTSAIISDDDTIDYLRIYPASQVVIRGLQFRGARFDDKQITPTNQKMIKLKGFRWSIIENCWFWGTAGYGIYIDADPLGDRNSFANHIRNCRFSYFGKAAISGAPDQVNGITIGPGVDMTGGRLAYRYMTNSIVVEGQTLTNQWICTSFVDPRTTNQINGIELSGNNVKIIGSLFQLLDHGIVCTVSGLVEPNIRSANWSIRDSYFESCYAGDMLFTGITNRINYLIGTKIDGNYHVVSEAKGIWDRAGGTYLLSDLFTNKTDYIISITNQLNVQELSWDTSFISNVPKSGKIGQLGGIFPFSQSIRLAGPFAAPEWWDVPDVYPMAQTIASGGVFFRATNAPVTASIILGPHPSTGIAMASSKPGEGNFGTFEDPFGDFHLARLWATNIVADQSFSVGNGAGGTAFVALTNSLQANVPFSGRIRIQKDGQLYLSEASAGLTISDLTDPTQLLMLGYDTNRPAAFIQSLHSGFATTPLLLNPAAGNVGISTNAPGYPLDVAGAIHSSDFLLLENNKWYSGKGTNGTDIALIGAGTDDVVVIGAGASPVRIPGDLTLQGLVTLPVTAVAPANTNAVVKWFSLKGDDGQTYKIPAYQ